MEHNTSEENLGTEKIGFKTALRIVGQYYSEHQIKLIIHLAIAITTAGIWAIWFFGVAYYVYTGPSEDSRIGKYMTENQYDEYVGENGNTGVFEEYEDWEDGEKKIHPDESPNMKDSILAVVTQYPRYYMAQPFVAILHFGLIIVTGGIFLFFYPARVAYIWFGTPLGPRTHQYLANKGYEFVPKNAK